jgi:hypothetical protein
MSAKVVGVSRLKLAFKEVGSAAGIAAQKALNQEALELLSEAKEIVPIDEGVLRSTGRVEEARKPGTISVEVKFGGGPASAYAIRQHEDMDLSHAPGKQSKYLEMPGNLRKQGMDKRISQAIGDDLGL